MNELDAKMVSIYLTLINNNLRSIDQVPSRIRDAVIEKLNQG